MQGYDDSDYYTEVLWTKYIFREICEVLANEVYQCKPQQHKKVSPHSDFSLGKVGEGKSIKTAAKYQIT